MPLDPFAVLAIVFGLQAKHFLFDFVLQSDWQVRNKGRYGHPGGLVHASLHGFGTLVVGLLAVFSGPFGLLTAMLIAAADLIVHYHIDWLKSQISRRMNLTSDRQGFWIAFGADQAAHQATYLGLVALAMLKAPMA